MSWALGVSVLLVTLACGVLPATLIVVDRLGEWEYSFYLVMLCLVAILLLVVCVFVYVLYFALMSR